MAITTDTFIVYEKHGHSRPAGALFRARRHGPRCHYLKYALAAVLVFIAAKIFVADFQLGGESSRLP